MAMHINLMLYYWWSVTLRDLLHHDIHVTDINVVWYACQTRKVDKKRICIMMNCSYCWETWPNSFS